MIVREIATYKELKHKITDLFYSENRKKTCSSNFIIKRTPTKIGDLPKKRKADPFHNLIPQMDTLKRKVKAKIKEDKNAKILS